MEASNTSKPITGGSILNAMDDLVKVGQKMGFNMEGCLKTYKKSLVLKEIQTVLDELYVSKHTRPWS